MLNIKSDAQGVAQVDVTAAGTSLHGDPGTDIMGKAVVVHEGPDDYTTAALRQLRQARRLRRHRRA